MSIEFIELDSDDLLNLHDSFTTIQKDIFSKLVPDYVLHNNEIHKKNEKPLEDLLHSNTSCFFLKQSWEINMRRINGDLFGACLLCKKELDETNLCVTKCNHSFHMNCFLSKTNISSSYSCSCACPYCKEEIVLPKMFDYQILMILGILLSFFYYPYIVLLVLSCTGGVYYVYKKSKKGN